LRILKNGKLRLAVVGLGKMGLVHAGILSVLRNVELVALCEKSKLIQRFSRKIFVGIEIVDDVKKLIDLNLDAVYITTPIRTHYALANSVLKEGIASHIFVEKTLCQSYQESSQLTELVNRKHCVNMVGYLRRFYVTFNKARELLLEGIIGDVASFKAYAYSSDFLGAGKNNISIDRGGVLRDLGCHAIDLALWFFDGLQGNSVKTSVCIDSAENSANLKITSSEIAGELDVSWLKEGFHLPEVGFCITGNRGELEVNDDQVKLRLRKSAPSTWYRHDLNDSVPFWLGLPEYYREDQYFVNSIINEKKAKPDFTDAARVDKIICEIDGEENGC
jgi:predicted dehydrogenase